MKTASVRNGRRIRGGVLFVCLAFLFLLTMQQASAAADPGQSARIDPANGREDYSAVLYDNKNGLPTSEANTIAQTDEGFLWIGSYSGLIRYDGNSFERIDSPTGVGSVMRLYVDSRDRLWIGTNENGLFMLERGEFRSWGEDEGLGSAKIRAITGDENGTIYVGTTAGITMIDPELNLHAVEDPRIAEVYMEALRMGADGLLYGLTDGGDVFTLRGCEVMDYIDHRDCAVQGITCILPDPKASGVVYVGTEESGIYHGDLRDGAGALEYLDAAPLACVNELMLIGDQLWICAQNGIGVAEGRRLTCLDELPMNSLIDHVMMDYEGNLWFTSSRQGVMKLVSNRFSDVFARFDLPERVVNATCMYGSQLFVATDSGLIVLDENGPVSSVPLTSAATASGAQLDTADLLEYLDGVRIRSIIRDSRGRLWISTWRACGLLRYDRGELTAFTEEDGLLSNRMRTVSETADGKILVACTGGMNVIEGNRVTASCGEEDGIANSVILCVCAAPNGDAILGSNGGGIYIVSGDGVRCIDTHDGLKSGVVMHIKYDAARDLFWLVAGNSIAYMSADYRVTTVQHFPYPDNSDLYENSRGDMWILSSDGIYVLPADELIANGEIRPLHYNMANGLPCTATFNSYSELTPEGDLYIAGTSGVAKVNIESALEDITDLKQAVPYLEADGALLYPDEDGGFTIPSETQKLTVYGFVFNYSLTDPQVSYRLEGFDQEAVTVSRSELGPVTYTNLRGGSYRFVMELKDGLGRGSRVLSVPILKEKAVYEQAWFYLVLGLAAMLLLAVLVGSYVRRKMRVLEEKHREEAERERIGNELSLATRIQADMLPNIFPAFPGRPDFDIYASMDPAKEVGGDFYDFFLVDDDHLCMVMADVSGKGVPAALFMMASKIILANNAMMGKSPAQILTDTNASICSHNRQEMFVTVWLGILELSTGKLIAANAGHEYPVLKKADGRFELLKDKHGFVIGGMEGIRYKEYELFLEPGAKLFLYTDGIPEATDAAEAMFGTERMLAALNREPDLPPEQILRNVRAAVNGFVNEAEQFDDLTMLCVEYHGPAPRQNESPGETSAQT